MKRNHPKGAAALEFAIGAPVVMTMFIGGFVLVYAAFTKERLTTATIQATRICAMRPANENQANLGNCVRNAGVGLMGDDNARCQGGAGFVTQQVGDPRDPRQISMLRVTGQCTYLSPVWPNRLPPMNLIAEARMPRLPMAGP